MKFTCFNLTTFLNNFLSIDIEFPSHHMCTHVHHILVVNKKNQSQYIILSILKKYLTNELNHRVINKYVDRIRLDKQRSGIIWTRYL